MTVGEAQTKLDKAVEMLRRFGKDEDADRFEAMSPQEYAAGKKAEIISNPHDFRRTVNVATKKDFEASIDEIGDLVDEALDPELSREQIVGKLKDIAEVLEGGGEEELGDEVEEDDEED